MTWTDWLLLGVVIALVWRWWRRDRQEFEEGRSRHWWDDRHPQTPEEAQERLEELRRDR